MLKARLLLALLMAGCMVAGYFIWQNMEAMNFGLAVFFLVIDAILYCSAGTLLLITFFALDEQGCIPRGSLAWKYFSCFYRKIEEVAGKIIMKIAMPEKIRICPSLWLIVYGFFSVVVLFFAVGVTGYFIIEMISKGAFGLPAWSHMRDILILLGVIGGLYIGVMFWQKFFIFLLRRFGKIFAVCWLFLGCVLAFSMFAALLAAKKYEQYVSWNAAFVHAVVDVVRVIGIILGFSIAFIALMFGVAWAALHIFPWIKNSLVGRFVAAWYGYFCPEIPIEPADETVPEE